MIINEKPNNTVISSTEAGYSIIKLRYGFEDDYDLESIAAWSKVSLAPKNTAIYTQVPYDRDNKIVSLSGLAHGTSYDITTTFIDSFVFSEPGLIQAQYYSNTPSVLNLTNTTISTINPVVITSIVNVDSEVVVGNPFSSLVLNTTGSADIFIVEVRNTQGSTWDRIYEDKSKAQISLTLYGGEYQVRYSSTKVFSDGTEETSPTLVYPSLITVQSGLDAPTEVTGVSINAFKNRTYASSYDLRCSWNYPTGIADQNKKRNFTVSLLPNPTFSTNFAALNWASSVEEVAIDTGYVFSNFPYRRPYVIRIGVTGWGLEASEYEYIPVYISRVSGESGVLGFIFPSEVPFQTDTKIQIDDEFIRAYKVFDAENPSNSIKTFELSALTGNVTIGSTGGTYNGSVMTTAPFIFDSTANKLQINGRVITDSIESASYVMTWIDAAPPSLRTAGKNSFGANAPGIWMGYTNPSTFMFDLGNAANYIRWNGNNLTISGTVQIGTDGRTLGQAQKQVFIYKRATEAPATPTGGVFSSPVPDGWSSTVPTGTEGVYMSSRLFTTDGAPPQDASWATPSLFSPGNDATITVSYTWIKYADDVLGTGISDDPTNKTFIGFAHNKGSAIESNNPADYVWSQLTGNPGIPGEDGEDGVTKYTWIKYSPFEFGEPTMTDSPDVDTLYIGIAANRDTIVESNVASDYIWSRFKGDQGIPGVQTFKSSVFRRYTGTPTTPTGGNFNTPVPADWSDGVPPGSLQLWMSTRVFTKDGLPPQQSDWTAPQALTSTSRLSIKYSSVETVPGDPSSAPSNWVDTADSTTIWMAQSTISNGIAGLWQVSKVKGEQGNQGLPGLTSKVVTLSASTNIVTYNDLALETPAGQVVIFSVIRQNTTGTTTWSAKDNTGATVTGLLTGVTNTSATLAGSSLSTRKSIVVSATVDGIVDSVTISKLQDGLAGKDSVIGVLSNEAHVIASDKDGVVLDWSSASGIFKVYKGTLDVTASSTFSIVGTVNCTAEINTSGAYAVTNMSADQGTVTFRATYSGTQINKVFSISKSKSGQTGNRGAGQYSAPFTNPTNTISNAMAIAATAATPNGIPIVGDVVTLYDPVTTTIPPVPMIFVGGTANLAASWTNFTVRIDGNLLVTGSVAANKINVADLFSQNATVSGNLLVGGGGTNQVSINGGDGSIVAIAGGNTIFSAGSNTGYLDGQYLASGSIYKESLSPSLKEWLSSLSGGGGVGSTGGSAETISGLVSGTFNVAAINCAAGTVELSLSYGGNIKTISSFYEPAPGTIQYRFLRNGNPITGYITLTGTVIFTTSNPEAPIDTYSVSMPPMSISYNDVAPAGSNTYAVQFIVTKPVSDGGVGWTSPLSNFYFSAFQELVGGPSGGTSSTLASLTDVNTAGAVNGNALVFSSAQNKWVPGAGGSATLQTLTRGTYLTGSNYNGSAATTWAVDATSSNSASKVVARDSSGNFSAGTITANLVGSATQLSTSRSISMTGDVTWDVNFNGAASVSAAATLKNSNSNVGTFGSGTTIPVITVNSKGLVTSVSTQAVSASSISGAGSTVSTNSYGAIIQSAQTDTYLYFQGGARGGIFGNSSGLNFLTPNLSGTFMSMSASGIWSNYNINAPDFLATSDRRVKDGLQVIPSPAEKLAGLTGYTYNRTDQEGRVSAGIIAQDLQKVLPEAVYTSDSGLLQINQGSVIGLLVEVCKDLQKQINQLKGV